ncbi:MAG: proton-conducting transporter membrane subunit [Syntrophales bacterium]|nr:proton-conducting transporter membrane subunit [Syntrophales bacterium]
MKAHWPILIVALPLIMSFVTFMTGICYRAAAYHLTVITAAFSTFIAICLFIQVIVEGMTISYHIGGWEPPWGIEYAVDHLNALVLLATSLIGLLTIIHSRKIVAREIGGEKTHIFYALVLLQITGLLGMTVTSDVFNLYVLLEIASFSAYGLIAVGRKGAEFAALRYMIFGTVGAGAYLLGVGYLYILTGSLNMSDLLRLLSNLYGSPTLLAGLLFILLGLAIKMAAFPLHGWLPDAYSQAPASTSTLLAPLFTKVVAYVIIRICFTVFHPSFALHTYPLIPIMGAIVGVGIIVMGVMAIAQSDIRRMLCYIVIAEVGYIILGLAAGNRLGMIGAILHIVYDMFMMALLFNAWATIYEHLKSSHISAWRGISKKYPLEVATFILGGLSVIGIPPFCGFFSKWFIILGLVEGGKWFLLATLLLSTLLAAVCFFRILEQTSLTHGSNTMDDRSEKKTSLSEGVVLASLSAFLIILGAVSGYLVSFIEKIPFLGAL